MNYNINTGLFANNLLPPDKRTTTMMYWVKALLSGTGWLNNIALGYYLDGLSVSTFDPSLAYTAGDTVLYQNAVYQAVCPNSGIPYTPAGNIPSGILPTNTDYYVLILPAPGFIGVNERIYYNGSTLTLTWALNRYFGTVFRQPASYLGQSPLSDIYILNFNNEAESFITGATETDSSTVAAIISSGYVLNTLSDNPLSDFAIYIPVATFNGIIGGEKTVRAFTDKYVISGINYAIYTY